MLLRAGLACLVLLAANARAEDPDGGAVIEAMDAGAPSFADTPVGVKIAMGRGVTISKGDSLSMTLRARVQLRDAVTVQDQTVSNEFAVRTVRLFMMGKVLASVGYFLQLGLGANDFETGVVSPVIDAFIEYTGLRDLQLRVGQFFVPFDRARTIREFSLQLVERQQVVNELSLDLDIGIVASSQDLFGWGGRLSYALGLFSGQGKNRPLARKTLGFLYVARAALRPFGPFDDDVEGDLSRLPRARRAVGVAGAFNQDSWRQRSTTGTFYTLGGYDQLHLAIDAVFKYRGVSLLAEALVRHAPLAMRSADVNGAQVTEYSRSAWGYLIQAGFMVTDQVELATRWDELRFLGGDPALAALVSAQGRELGAGVNVYFNGHAAKVQADWSMRFGSGGVKPQHQARVVLDVMF